MTVYQVKMPFYDDDHDHGSYRSPLFATREVADQFMAQVVSDRAANRPGAWWSAGDYDQPIITELEVLESWTPPLKSAEEYLEITYT